MSDPIEERRHQVEHFIRCSPWQDDVSTVPDTHVDDWGTLAWAQYASALLEALAVLRGRLEHEDETWIGNALSREIERRETAEASVVSLKEALREYADPKMWRVTPDNEWVFLCASDEEATDVARAALASSEGEG